MKAFVAGWYVLYTRPHHEKKVTIGLSESDITFFLPMHKVLRKWHDRKKFIDVPLFQSYVFVYLKSLKDYFDSLNNDGVVRFIRFGKEISRVSNKVIDDIRMIVNSGQDIEVSSDYFRPGQQLYICQGPLTGTCCEVVESGNKQKIIVRVHLLQRNLLITLPSDNLMMVSA